MIKKIDLTDNNTILRLVSLNKQKNLYLYLDYNFYSIESPEIDTWIQINKKRIINIILRYRNTIQLMNIVKDIDASDELSFFLRQNNFSMISGEKSLIDSLVLDGYRKTSGFFMKHETFADENDKGITIMSATASNYLLDASKLICSDESIGRGHYTIDDLFDQLSSRQREWGCKNYVLVVNDDVAGHVGTYAESNDSAIIGGLIVDKRFRGNNYGNIMLSYICRTLLKEKKTPYLYCYNEILEKYYKKQGWKTILCVAKLEKAN